MSEQHNPCQYVEREVGTDPELRRVFFEDPELVAQTAQLIELAYERQRPTTSRQAAFEQSMGLREPARRALSTLACDSCLLSKECAVKKRLEENAQRYELYKEAVRHFSRHADGPDWLQQARRQRATYPDVASFVAAAGTEGTLPMALLGGGVDVESPRYLFTKDQLPELRSFEVIGDTAQLPGVALTTNNHRFLVVDAREAVGLDDHMPSEEEARILYGKFLGRIVEETPSGTPHILEPDNTMQKVITRVEGGRLDELRMSGKNRFYITVCREADHTRIVLLGIHGGDATTQRKFLNALIGSK